MTIKRALFITLLSLVACNAFAEPQANVTLPFSSTSKEQPDAAIVAPFAPSKPTENTADSENLDTIVAIVNDEVITKKELDQHTEVVKFQLNKSQTQLPPEKQLRLQVLNHLIDQKLQLQTAEKAGIEIDDMMIDDAIKNIADKNHITVETLKQTLAEDGTSYPDYRADIQKQLTIQKLLEREVASKITLSKQELEKYLNSVAFDQQNIAEYHLADILISLPEVPSSQEIQAANKKAENIQAKLKDGKNFSELAIAYSDGPEGLQGGDLGWRRNEEIPAVFASAIEGIQPGDYTAPIRTPNGIHIVKLVEIRGSAARHFATETHVSHILLKPEIINDDTSTKAKLAHLKARIEQGESFATIAKQYSQDKISAANGGDLGWVAPGIMVPSFEKAMNEQKIGVVGDPVKSEFGWHLVLVTERREKDDTREFRESEVRKMVYERQFAEKAQIWIKRLRAVSYVQILIPTELTPFDEA